MTVCATLSPLRCHDERLKLVDPPISLLQCEMSMAIFPELMQWRLDHPEWRVTGWHCREYVPEKDA